MMRKALCLWILVLVANYGIGKADDSNTGADEDAISPMCASVLIAGATGVGGIMVSTMTPTVLCTAGFCQTGVAASSFASWWQSTMPLIAKNSIFATLQSIAMTGGGVSSTVVATGAIGGGLLGLAYIQKLCKFVDETDPDSPLGMTLAANHAAVIAAIKMKDEAQAQCAASSTCTETMRTVEKAGTAAYNMANEAGSVAAKTVSSWWGSIKSVASRTGKYLQILKEIYDLKSQIKALKNEFGLQSFDIICSTSQATSSWWADRGLKDICDQYINDARVLAARIRERLAEDPQASVSFLEEEIKEKVGEFGVHAFDYLQGRGIVASYLAPLEPRVASIHQEKMAKVRVLEEQLQEKILEKEAEPTQEL